MKIFRADIGHAPELHKLFLEHLQDAGVKHFPTPDFWFFQFRDPTFFCLYMKHGKKKVGMIMGRILPYYEKPVAHIDVFFVRRGFKSFRFIKRLYVAGKRHLIENKVGEAIVNLKLKERIFTAS
jgi:hypothetical protein